ncbi:unnamed protein product [Sphenostylis stenocarpa]|uniref:Uncharacterized protein n=1 Tax=Sphenostylis stenocarpa TaxID=92480 RepID=A0AA86SMX2_9FABA|nr:unnamed protein product [Sphenostylis stenocarpa]
MNGKANVTKELNAKHKKLLMVDREDDEAIGSLADVFFFKISILEGLLKLPENRECADCKAKYVSGEAE